MKKLINSYVWVLFMTTLLFSTVRAAGLNQGDQRSPGKISANTVEFYQEMLGQVDALLPKWQKHQEAIMVRWYPRLVELKATLKAITETGSQEDVFKLIPFNVDYAREFAAISRADSDDETRGINAETKALRCILWDYSLEMIGAMAGYIGDHNGDVPRQLMTRFLDYILTPHVVAWAREVRSAGDWIDITGMFVLDPDFFFEYVKRLPKNATENLDPCFRMDSFDDFEAKGVGMSLLKTRYTGNREHIVQVRASMLRYLADHTSRK